MTDLNVTMRLRGEAAGLKRAGQEGKKALDEMQTSAGKARAGLGSYTASADRAERSTGRLAERAREASNVIRTVIAAAAIRQASQLADQYINIQSRLELVTKSEERYAAARDQTYQISQRTFTALESTATLYGRMQQSTDQLGRSQADALRTTELINKTFQISGTEAATASAAIIQLSQGLSAGALRGDEFNSVMEGAPRLADALGASLGKTRGELRAMAEEGRITADVIIDAILKQGDTIDAEFDRLQVTAGRGWQNVVNAATRALGEISQATGATVTIGAGLQELAGFIETLPQRVEVFGQAWQMVAGESSDAIGEFFDLFGERFGDTMSAAIDELTIFPVSVRAAVTIVLGEWDKLLVTMEEGWDSLFVNLDASWEVFKVAIGQQIPLLRDALRPDFTGIEQPGDADQLATIQAEADARKKAFDDAVEGVLRQREAMLKQLQTQRELAEAEKNGTAVTRQGTAATNQDEAARRAHERALKAQTRAMQEQRQALTFLRDLIEDSRIANEAMRRAVQENRAELDKVTASVARLMQDGPVVADVQRTIAEAYAAVTRNARDRLEVAESESDVFEDAIRSEREAIEVLRQSGRAREQLIDQLEIEAAIRQLTQGMTDEQVRAYQDEIATLAELIAERQRAQRIDAARNTVFGGVSSLLDGALREVQNGANVWDAFRSAGTQAIGDVSRGFIDLIRETGSFADAIGELTKPGGQIQELGLQLASVVGVALGGGGPGASLGSAIGAAIGSLGGPIGTAIGSVLGGLVGGLFDDDPNPRIRANSSGVNIGRRGIVRGETALGSLALNVDDVQNSGQVSRDLIDAISAVDQNFTTLVRTFGLGEAQLDALRAAADRWRIDLSGDEFTPEAVIESRFNVLLDTFSDSVQEFVRSAGSDIEQQFARLADYLTLDRLANDADLVTDSLDSALTLISEFAIGSERVIETYQRIAQAAIAMDTALVLMGLSLDGTREQIVRQAAELAEAAGSPERAQALWDAFFENFYTDGERALARLTQARSGADSEFADIGLNVADYLGPGGRDRFRAEFEAIFESLSAAQRVQYLEAAAALGLLNDAQAAYNATLGETVTVIAEFNQRAAESYAQAAEGIRNSLADLAASSPFQRALLDIGRQLRSNIDTLQRTAREAGLQAAAEQDLADAHTLAAARAAQALAQLLDAGRQQAADLYGSALGDIDAQIAALSASSSSSLSGFGRAMGDVARQADEATRLLLGDLSPLKDRAKLDIALQALQRGEISGDQVLRIADRLFASGADFNRVFQQVQQIVAGQAGAQPGAAEPAGGDVVSVRLQQLQAERERLLAEQSGLQRFGQARDLAQTVADIAGATGESIEDVFRNLVGDRATLADFAADLRLDSVEALDAYIASLQAETYDFSQISTDLRDVFAEHINSLREIFGLQQSEGTLRIVDGEQVKPAPGVEFGYEPIPVAGGKVAVADDGTAETNALLRRLVDSIEVLTERLPAAAEETADATADVRDAIGALTAALERKAPASGEPRSARTKPLEYFR